MAPTTKGAMTWDGAAGSGQQIHIYGHFGGRHGARWGMQLGIVRVLLLQVLEAFVDTSIVVI